MMRKLSTYKKVKYIIFLIIFIVGLSVYTLTQPSEIDHDFIRMHVTSSIQSLSDLDRMKTDIVQVKVLDHLTKQNSVLISNQEMGSDMLEYYSIRKVEVVQDSISGLKQGTTLNLRQIAALNDRNQVYIPEGILLLEKGNTYSVAITKTTDKKEDIIITHPYAIQEYSVHTSHSAEENLALLMHQLYQTEAVSPVTIQQITTAHQCEKEHHEMKTYNFISFNKKEAQLYYHEVSNEGRTYFEYNNYTYTLQGEIKL